MLPSRYGLYYLHARGDYYLATQRDYAALTDFLACGDLVRALGLDNGGPVPWRISAAEACLRLGYHDRASRLVREQLSRSDAAEGDGRGRALRMLAALSSPQRRPHLLLEAVELFEEIGDQYEQAQVLTDLGQAYSALGDSRRARTTQRRARYLAQSCGATVLGGDVLALQGPGTETGADEEEAHQLTDSERRVGHLAVIGYTNREIAAKLYVTSSTVEQHLTRVYRKLGVRHRKDLPPDLEAVKLKLRVQHSTGSRSAS
jgi:DNA-binding CsgD family transcriptional regulator